MNSVRLPCLRRDLDLKIMTHMTHMTHTGASVCHVCHCALVTHMAHTGRVLVGRAGRAGRAGAGRGLTHTTHGVVSAHYPGLLVSAYQPGGGSGRAERLGPQLRSVSKQFLFL